MRCIYEGLGRRSLLFKTSMLESEWDIREKEEGEGLDKREKWVRVEVGVPGAPKQPSPRPGSCEKGSRLFPTPSKTRNSAAAR